MNLDRNRAHPSNATISKSVNHSVDRLTDRSLRREGSTSSMVQHTRNRAQEFFHSSQQFISGLWVARVGPKNDNV